MTARRPRTRKALARPAPPPRRAVSLARALSKLGIASRPEARALIAAGRVRVGGCVVRDPARRVDLAHDAISLDGAPARRAAPVVWMLHKPIGYVTTRRDPERRATVYDLLPRDLPHVVPVGRLDLDTSGLLLLTNDTQLAAFLTDPATHVAKVYEVGLDAPIAAADAARLAAGVTILGRRTRPARVEFRGAPPAAALRVTLVEGRNRQVRRMFATLGRTVRELRRVAFGPLRLGDLAAGDCRALHADELRALARLRGTQPPSS